MVLCPVALAVGCKKCPVFNLCPAKGLIGDFKVDADATPSPPAAARASKARAKPRRKR
jgi:hypothetical protein